MMCLRTNRSRIYHGWHHCLHLWTDHAMGNSGSRLQLDGSSTKSSWNLCLTITIKFKLRQTKVKYIVNIFTVDGIQPDPDKVAAINRHENVNAVQRFIGLATYLSWFMPHLSNLRTFATCHRKKSHVFQAISAGRSIIECQTYCQLSTRSQVL